MAEKEAPAPKVDPTKVPSGGIIIKSGDQTKRVDLTDASGKNKTSK